MIISMIESTPLHTKHTRKCERYDYITSLIRQGKANQAASTGSRRNRWRFSASGFYPSAKFLLSLSYTYVCIQRTYIRTYVLLLHCCMAGKCIEVHSSRISCAILISLYKFSYPSFTILVDTQFQWPSTKKAIKYLSRRLKPSAC